MRIIQNGQPREAAGAFANAEELAVSLVASGDEAPQIVVSMRLDGVGVPGERLADLSEISLVGVREVEIATRPARELALQSLDSAAAYAGEVGKALTETAELMRASRPEVANEQFAEVIDAMSVLFFALDAAARQLGEEAVGIESIGERIQPWLDQILEAQQTQDWIRVADYLEYEVGPVIDDAPTMIRSVAERCALG